MLHRRFAVLGAALIALGTVNGVRADLDNVRPIYTTGSTLDSLQSVFDSIGSAIDVRTEQSGHALFGHQSSASNTTYTASMSWDADAFPFEFGIYDATDETNRVAVFRDATNGTGEADPGDFTTIVFDASANAGAGAVYTEYHDAGTIGSSILDVSDSFFEEFGFYFSWTDTEGAEYLVFSEDSRNDGLAAFMAFQGRGDDVVIGGMSGNDANHWYLAFDGFDGLLDFDDIVVQLESITPMPVPGAALLAAVGFGAAATFRRRLGSR